MPNPQTKIFVIPGAGRKIPLPIPGENISVPAEGRMVVNGLAVQRLLRCDDLIESPVPDATKTAPSAAAKTAAPVSAAVPTDTKES